MRDMILTPFGVKTQPNSTFRKAGGTVPNEVIDAISEYNDVVADASLLRSHVGNNEHYWTTAGELYQRIQSGAISLPVQIVRCHSDYDMPSYWSRYVVYDIAVRLGEHTGYELYTTYDDVEAVRSVRNSLMKEYPEEFADYTGQDWIEHAAHDEDLFSHERILVIQEHPTLF